MDTDVQEGLPEMGGKLRVSFRKVLFGEMEDANSILARLMKLGKEVKG